MSSLVYCHFGVGLVCVAGVRSIKSVAFQNNVVCLTRWLHVLEVVVVILFYYPTFFDIAP